MERSLSQDDVAAVMNYVRGVSGGRPNVPARRESLNAEIDEAIRQAALFYALLRVIDYSLIERVHALMVERDVMWMTHVREYGRISWQ